MTYDYTMNSVIMNNSTTRTFSILPTVHVTKLQIQHIKYRNHQSAVRSIEDNRAKEDWIQQKHEQRRKKRFTAPMVSRSNPINDWNGYIIIVYFLLLSTAPSDVSSFAFPRIRQAATVPKLTCWSERLVHGLAPASSLSTPRTSKLTTLSMVREPDDRPGLSSTSTIAGILFAVFIAGSLLPLAGTLDLKPAPIADAVVTRQDAPGRKNVESKQYALSRSAIQEKLNTVPVFYVATTGEDGSAAMSTNIYLSYQVAKEASDGIPSSSVKGTTLDQVMYVRSFVFICHWLPSIGSLTLVSIKITAMLLVK